MGRAAHLVPGERRVAGQPRGAAHARARGRADRRPAQRPLEHDRRLHPRRPDAHVRRARGRSRAGHRPHALARDAGPGARRDRRRGGRHRRLADLLRRGGRRGRAGRGGALPRRAARGGRGLGRAPALPRGPARGRALARRRPGGVEHPQDRRLAHPVGDDPPGPRPRAGSTRRWWTAASPCSSPPAPTRCSAARSTRPAGRPPRAAASCSARRWRRWPRCGRRCGRSTGSTCSTSEWWARRGCTRTTRCDWRSTCAEPARAATSWPRCCATAAG